MASRLRATIVSVLFGLFVGPGPVAILVPWLITRWRWEPVTGWRLALRAIGFLLIAAGAPTLVAAIARFVYEGRGTLAPVVPTEELVVHGAYRYVRNPMYLSVLAIIMGQALVFQSWWVALYGAVVAVGVNFFVRMYEEPTLERTYGDVYERYRSHVPRWLPRTSPWRGNENRNS